MTLCTLVNTSAAPGEALRTSHKPANTVIRFLKVQDPLELLLWDVCEVGTREGTREGARAGVGDWGGRRLGVVEFLGLSSPVDPSASTAVGGIDDMEVARGREWEWSWSNGMRQDLWDDASTVKASSSLFDPELLSANASNCVVN